VSERDKVSNGCPWILAYAAVFILAGLAFWAKYDGYRRGCARQKAEDAAQAKPGDGILYKCEGSNTCTSSPAPNQAPPSCPQGYQIVNGPAHPGDEVQVSSKLCIIYVKAPPKHKAKPASEPKSQLIINGPPDGLPCQRNILSNGEWFGNCAGDEERACRKKGWYWATYPNGVSYCADPVGGQPEGKEPQR